MYAGSSPLIVFNIIFSIIARALNRPNRRFPARADVDECASNPCANGGECEHVSFPMPHTSCHCVGGYEGPHCEDAPAGPCSPNPCMNGGSCASDGRFPIAGATCTCVGGYSGSECETAPAVDLCAVVSCANGGSCAVVHGGSVFAPTETAECQCVGGFSGDSCEVAPAPVDLCNPSPCLHMGTCTAAAFPTPHPVCA